MHALPNTYASVVFGLNLGLLVPHFFLAIGAVRVNGHRAFVHLVPRSLSREIKVRSCFIQIPVTQGKIPARGRDDDGWGESNRESLCGSGGWAMWMSCRCLVNLWHGKSSLGN